jgi:hypothetical protein
VGQLDVYEALPTRRLLFDVESFHEDEMLQRTVRRVDKGYQSAGWCFSPTDRYRALAASQLPRGGMD